MSRNIRRSSEQWSKVIDAYQTGSESEQGFCQRHGLVLSTFRKWRYRFGSREGTVQPLSSSSSFVEVLPRKNGQDSPFTVRVGDDICVEIPGSQGLESVARLIETLRHGR